MMTKRRTKKQKIKAKKSQVKKIKLASNLFKEKKIKKENKIPEEVKVIVRDLIKTGVIALIILGLLIGIYWKLG